MPCQRIDTYAKKHADMTMILFLILVVSPFLSDLALSGLSFTK